MTLKKSIFDNIKLHKKLLSSEKNIYLAINKIYNSLKGGGKVMICGNGGSAADAQHLAAEFLIRLRPTVNRKGYPVITLAQDTSTLTACGNDLGFNKIFSRTLSALGNKKDILITISTSGNSKNIIEVLKQAKKQNIYSIAFLGNKGGKVKNLTKQNIIVDSKNTARIQEAHIFIGHFIFEEVEKLMMKLKRKNT